MNFELIIPFTLLTIFWLFGISLLIYTKWWREFNLNMAIAQEKSMGNFPIIGWWLRLNIKWQKGKFGIWYPRIFGIIWLAMIALITVGFLFSYL